MNTIEGPEEPQSDYDESAKCLEELMSQYLIIKKNDRIKFLQEMPAVVLRNVNALKKLQISSINLEAEYHHEVYQLERKFECKHNEVYDKRAEIINGKYEPTDEDCQLPESIQENLIGKEDEKNAKTKGIPKFWLTAIKNCPELASLVKTIDEPILKHLIDIRGVSKPMPDLSFILEFHFSPNKYFTETVLTKTYLMKCCLDPEDPFSFEGPEIYSTIGCKISWNPNESVTQRVIDGKLFKSDSFFNFFDPPVVGEVTDSAEQDKIEEFLETDFEIGHFMKERVIPRAILYFTGEIELGISSDEDSMGSTTPQCNYVEEDPGYEGIAGEGDN